MMMLIGRGATVVAVLINDLIASIKAKSGELKEKSKELSERLHEVSNALESLLYQVPNTPNEIVPEGKTPEENEVVFSKGEIPSLHSGAKPHWELANDYDLIDFELGVKISGAGFPVYKGKGARLQRALINFFLDQNIAAGYAEVQPPHLINEASGYGTGQLPDKEGQMYHVTGDDLYLIPTAEVPLTNLIAGDILDPSQLPIRMTAHTPCFRSEAGAAGRDTRGMIRMHQFDKVELVSIVAPGDGISELERMTQAAESVLKRLELPYRVVLLCSGDMGFSAEKTYDIEAWIPSENKYREISSCSSCGTFQAKRMNAKYKSSKGSDFVATLNGSGLAVGRLMISLIENYQNEDGSVTIPSALRKYMNNKEKI